MTVYRHTGIYFVLHSMSREIELIAVKQHADSRGVGDTNLAASPPPPQTSTASDGRGGEPGDSTAATPRSHRD